MLDKFDSEIADEVMSLLSSQYPEALSVDELTEELDTEREAVRQTCLGLHNRTMSEDGLSQTGDFKYRFSPGDDSKYNYTENL
jgi:hypothetical protein